MVLFDTNKDRLALVATVRAHGAIAMGLVKNVDEAAESPHTPKLAFVAKPAPYTASDGRPVAASSIDLPARIFSMGVLHHAMTGTGAVAIAAAAAIPGTLVHRVAPIGADGRVRFGHPSGSLEVGAEAAVDDGQWAVRKVIMSRSARRLMEGFVRVPARLGGRTPAAARSCVPHYDRTTSLRDPPGDSSGSYQ